MLSHSIKSLAWKLTQLLGSGYCLVLKFLPILILQFVFFPYSRPRVYWLGTAAIPPLYSHFSNMIEFIFTSYVFWSPLTSLLSSKHTASSLTWGPKIFAAPLETPGGSQLLSSHHLCLSQFLRWLKFSQLVRWLWLSQSVALNDC